MRVHYQSLHVVLVSLCGHAKSPGALKSSSMLMLMLHIDAGLISLLIFFSVELPSGTKSSDTETIMLSDQKNKVIGNNKSMKT